MVKPLKLAAKLAATFLSEFPQISTYGFYNFIWYPLMTIDRNLTKHLFGLIHRDSRIFKSAFYLNRKTKKECLLQNPNHNNKETLSAEITPHNN